MGSFKIVFVLALLLFGVRGSIGEEIRPAADAPQPHPPGVSQKMFRVEPGFRVELVASEPHLADPSSVTFDARGRMFACEIHGYNFEGYFDISSPSTVPAAMSS